MMYFCTYIAVPVDGSELVRSTTGYNTVTEARKMYHNLLASAVGKEDYSDVLAMVYGIEGNLLYRESWHNDTAASQSIEGGEA